MISSPKNKIIYIYFIFNAFYFIIYSVSKIYNNNNLQKKNTN